MARLHQRLKRLEAHCPESNDDFENAMRFFEQFPVLRPTVEVIRRAEGERTPKSFISMLEPEASALLGDILRRVREASEAVGEGRHRA